MRLDLAASKNFAARDEPLFGGGHEGLAYAAIGEQKSEIGVQKDQIRAQNEQIHALEERLARLEVLVAAGSR